MASWTELPVVEETCDLCYKMWQKGWTPGGGGNVSVLLDDEQVATLNYTPGTGRVVPFAIPDGVRGRYVLVTATGSHFRALKDDPDRHLGVVYVPLEGDYYEVAAGFRGGRPTGELDSHLAAHAVRLSVDPKHRVVMHNHARSILEMTHVGPTDERAFNLALWRIIPEASLFLADGLGLLPWCVPCTEEMAALTLESMKRHRIVVWRLHGIFGAGQSLPELFGNLELAELCCQAWLDIQLHGGSEGISDEGIRGIWKRFNVSEHADYLD
jgi:rhamnulose-1-phosphate aldolase